MLYTCLISVPYKFDDTFDGDEISFLTRSLEESTRPTPYDYERASYRPHSYRYNYFAVVDSKVVNIYGVYDLRSNSDLLVRSLFPECRADKIKVSTAIVDKIRKGDVACSLNLPDGKRLVLMETDYEYTGEIVNLNYALLQGPGRS